MSQAPVITPKDELGMASPEDQPAMLAAMTKKGDTPATQLTAPRELQSSGPSESIQSTIDALHRQIRGDQNFRRMSPEEQLHYVQTSLTANPKFRSASEEDQVVVAKHVLDQVSQPTTGEQIQSGLEVGAPIAGAVGAGAIHPALAPAGAAASHLVTEGARPFTTGEAPRIGEGLTEAAKDFFFVAAGEGILQKAKSVLGGMRQKMIAPGATSEETVAARRALEPYGAVLTPKQLSGEATPGFVEFLQNVAENAIGSRTRALKNYTNTDQALAQYVNDVEQQLLPTLKSNPQLATEFVDHYLTNARFARQVSSFNHRVVDELNNFGATVETGAAIRRTSLGPISDRLFNNFEVPEILKAGQPTRPGFAGREGFFDMMNSVGRGETNFETADRARSALLEISRTAKVNDPQVAKMAALMAEDLRTAMDRGITQLSNRLPGPQVQQLKDAYTNAKLFHKQEVIERFNDKLLLKVVDALKAEPAMLSQILLRPNRVHQLEVVRDAAPSLWPEIQGRLITSILGKARMTHALGIGMSGQQATQAGMVKSFNGPAIIKAFQSLGEDYTKVLLGPGSMPLVRDVANAIEVAARRPSGPGKIITSMTQATAASTIAKAPLDLSGAQRAGGATLLMLSPIVLGRIFTSKSAMRNLADGLIGGPKSDAFLRTLAFATATNRKVQESALTLAKEATSAALPRKATSPVLAPERGGASAPGLAPGKSKSPY